MSAIALSLLIENMYADDILILVLGLCFSTISSIMQGALNKTIKLD